MALYIIKKKVFWQYQAQKLNLTFFCPGTYILGVFHIFPTTFCFFHIEKKYFKKCGKIFVKTRQN